MRAPKSASSTVWPVHVDASSSRSAKTHPRLQPTVYAKAHDFIVRFARFCREPSHHLRHAPQSTAHSSPALAQPTHHAYRAHAIHRIAASTPPCTLPCANRTNARLIQRRSRIEGAAHRSGRQPTQPDEPTRKTLRKVAATAAFRTLRAPPSVTRRVKVRKAHARAGFDSARTPIASSRETIPPRPGSARRAPARSQTEIGQASGW